MRHLVWLPILAALACTPTRPDNGDLGGAKKEGTDAHGGDAGHSTDHQEKADFTWLTTPGVAGYREIDIGHGRVARVVKEGTRAELVKLLAKGIAANSVVVQARHTTSLPAGAFAWYEVAGAKSLTVLYTPQAIPAATPTVAADERIVNDPAFGEQILHKQVEGTLNADAVAEVFVRTIENPAGFLGTHAAVPKIEYDDQGTRKPVQSLQVDWVPGTTVTLTGGPCPIPTPSCVVCAVASGQAVATPVPNSSKVDVAFTPNNLLLKMY